MKLAMARSRRASAPFSKTKRARESGSSARRHFDRCLCGSVRYVCTAKPIHTFFCHCRDCQKESGAPFVSEVYVPRSSVKITGTMRKYTRTGDSGRSVHRNFCSSCGSVILTEFEVDPDNVAVKACSLDDASWLTPDFHLYITRKQPWLKLSDGLPQFDRDF